MSDTEPIAPHVDAGNTQDATAQVKSGKRTLLLSVLMSSTGPVVLGAAAFFGRSSTQIADLVRRTAEFLAILVSYLVYRAVNAGEGVDKRRKARLEAVTNRVMGSVMVASGTIMAALAIFTKSEQAGSVIPSVLIALQGMLVNGLFWRKYSKLSAADGDAILASQAKLYRAKTFVDSCVLLALLFVAFAPTAPITPLVDTVGSVIVAIYLVYSGVNVIREQDGINGHRPSLTASDEPFLDNK